jgi:molybdopterin-guanine dinucleotide biosynthesis protein A
MFDDPFPVTAMVLAGGRGARVGWRDKGLLSYKGKPLIDHVIERLSPQVEELLISANRNLDDYVQRGYPVLADTLPDFAGPLAGVLVGLQKARFEWLVVSPCDTPLLPLDLVDRLCRARGKSRAVVAKGPLRTHYTTLMLHKDRLGALSAYLERGGRSAKGFLEAVGATTAEFVDEKAFRNFNQETEFET